MGIKSNTSKTVKETAGFICLILAIVIFCFGASAVFVPKRYDNGANWGMYLEEPKDSIDIMFFGSSLSFCGIIPAVVYEETGYTSYVLGGPSQTLPVTYEYLKEALKTQSPKLIFVEVSSLVSDRYNSSTKINLCYMPWSLNRLEATFKETTGEERLGLLFPVYAYHSRWSELSITDITEGLLGYSQDSLAGYTFLEEALKVSDIGNSETDTIISQDYETNISYAEKIQELCNQNGIKAVFYTTASASPLDKSAMGNIESSLNSKGMEFFDCQDDISSLGLDLETDFFDELHFNYRGAEKFSKYMSSKIAEYTSDMTLSHIENTDILWNKRVSYFISLRDEANSKPIKYRR